MTKSEFKQMIIAGLQKNTPANVDWTISEKTVTKNNGEEREAVTIKENDSRIECIIYIDELYATYDNETKFDEMLSQIIKQMLEKPRFVHDMMKQINDFDKMQDKIIATVINTKQNEQALSGLPHRNIHDLSIVYRVVLNTEPQIATILIDNTLMQKWGVNEELLCDCATLNTRELLPTEVTIMCQSATNVVQLDACEASSRCFGEKMYVVTNKLNYYGAVNMFDTDILLNIAKRMHVNNLYVIPSSIHEVILCRMDAMTIEDMKLLIRGVNATEISPMEVLSDHPYLFDAKTMKIYSI